jgi:hypothetical protein
MQDNNRTTQQPAVSLTRAWTTQGLVPHKCPFTRSVRPCLCIRASITSLKSCEGCSCPCAGQVTAHDLRATCDMLV